MGDKRFQVIVLGGGPGGYTAAIRSAQHGFRTAIIEKRQLGGTCLNRGCIPTKALMHVSGLYREMMETEDLGLFATGLRYDMERIYGRKNDVVQELREGVSFLIDANGISHYQGSGTLLPGKRVQVFGPNGEIDELEWEHVILATGATAAKPPIPGTELPFVLTSDDLLDGPAVNCKRLVIIGGGVVGVEIASIYRNLGAEVMILEKENRILPLMDREISQNLNMILKKRGIIVHSGSSVKEIRQSEEGLTVLFQGKEGEQEALGDVVLLSTGRKANVEGLLGPGMDLEQNRGIVVNERFQTSIPDVYAIGDCISGGIQLAHVAAAQAGAAVSSIAGEDVEAELSVVPACIYTDPEIASVGITADEAKKIGKTVKSGKYIMSGNGKSVIEGQERGFIKLVFDGETEELLGAHLMCGRATELISGLAAAIVGKMTRAKLASVIYPHPTFGEGIGEAVDDLFGTSVHVAPKRKPK